MSKITAFTCPQCQRSWIPNDASALTTCPQCGHSLEPEPVVEQSPNTPNDFEDPPETSEPLTISDDVAIEATANSDEPDPQTPPDPGAPFENHGDVEGWGHIYELADPAGSIDRNATTIEIDRSPEETSAPLPITDDPEPPPTIALDRDDASKRPSDSAPTAANPSPRDVPIWAPVLSLLAALMLLGLILQYLSG